MLKTALSLITQAAMTKRQVNRKAAPIKKQVEAKQIQADKALSMELMRLEHIQELQELIKAKKLELREAKEAATVNTEAESILGHKENDRAKEKELHETKMRPFMFKKVKPDGYYKYWVEC